MIRILFVAAMAAFAQTGIPEWMQQANQRWFATLQSADAAALAKLYTADAVSMTASRVLRGRKAIEAFHRANFQKSVPDCTWKIEGAYVLERQAAAWGTDQCTEKPRSGAASWTSKSRWLTVYEKQESGVWLIVRESYDLIPEK